MTAASQGNHQEREKDFDWALGLNRFSLRLMGVWPETDSIKKESFGAIIRIPIMVLIMLFSYFLPQMYALYLVRKELSLVIDNLMTSCPGFTSCLKLFFMWNNRRVLLPVVKSVTEDWLRPKFNWERKAMEKEASYGRIFTITCYVFIGCSYVGFVFLPLLGFDIRIINNITDYGERNLLTQTYFPYDYSKTPVYELTHSAQLFSALFIAMAVSIPDNYFAALVFHASAQFEILGARIERFIRDNHALYADQRNKHFNRQIGIFVRRHVHLMNMVKAVEKTFNLILLTQIFCLTLMACCLGFQILSVFGDTEDKPSPFQVLTLIACLLTLMIHTLADCYASETLAKRSSAIFDNIYNSSWCTAPKQSTRDFVLMMMVSRSPHQLTVGKILSLSLMTYTSILKSIAGYISMLVAVSAE